LCPVLPPQNKKKVKSLQLEQQKAIRTITTGALALCRGAEEYDLFSLEKTQLHGDLTAAPQHLWEVGKMVELGFLQGCREGR